MNIWHDIASERVNPQDFYAIIEIPKGCKVKYELDKETGMLLMDRVLYTSTHYPANYGFIPKTYADDHDPLDVLLLCSETLVPLSMVRCFPIGVIMMEDGGEKDEKIIALPYGDPTYNSYKDISELPEHIMERNVPFLFRVQGAGRQENLHRVHQGSQERRGNHRQLHCQIQTGIPAVRQVILPETEMCRENVSVSSPYLPVSLFTPFSGSRGKPVLFH